MFGKLLNFLSLAVQFLATLQNLACDHSTWCLGGCPKNSPGTWRSTTLTPSQHLVAGDFALSALSLATPFPPGSCSQIVTRRCFPARLILAPRAYAENTWSFWTPCVFEKLKENLNELK